MAGSQENIWQESFQQQVMKLNWIYEHYIKFGPGKTLDLKHLNFSYLWLYQAPEIQSF